MCFYLFEFVVVWLWVEFGTDFVCFWFDCSFLAVEGFVVDDRHQAKDLAQVYKDVVRDTVVIDGREYVCASGDIIIQSLFSQIYDLFRRHHCIGVGEEEEEGDDCQKDHYITKNALAYTRAVLLASCRTVSGGDTYDGKMVVFHCVCSHLYFHH